MNDKKKLIRMNDPLDLEPMNPVPVPGYEGFYYFPLDKRLATHRVGAIIRVSDGKLYPHYQNKADRLFIIAYLDGKPKNYSVYRILAATFIGRPSRHLDKKLEELQVNHIDGDQANFNLDNLEWVTQKENAEHASLSGFILCSLPVVAKNTVTGEETKYRTIRECSKVFNLNMTGMWHHLAGKMASKRHVNGFIFKFDNDKPWPPYNPKHLEAYGTHSIPKAVLVIDTRLANDCKNKNIIFPNVGAAAKFLKCVKSSLRGRLKRNYISDMHPYKVCYLLEKNRGRINN